jgi:hypothetical protein
MAEHAEREKSASPDTHSRQDSVPVIASCADACKDGSKLDIPAVLALTAAAALPSCRMTERGGLVAAAPQPAGAEQIPQTPSDAATNQVLACEMMGGTATVESNRTGDGLPILESGSPNQIEAVVPDSAAEPGSVDAPANDRAQGYTLGKRLLLRAPSCVPYSTRL